MNLPCEAWEHQATLLLKTSRQYEDSIVRFGEGRVKLAFDLVSPITTRISHNFRVLHTAIQ